MPKPSLETTPETAAFYDVRRGVYARWADAYRAAHRLPADHDLGAEWQQRAGWGLDAIAAEINRLAEAIARREHPGLFEEAEPAESLEQPTRGVDPRLSRA